MKYLLLVLFCFSAFSQTRVEAFKKTDGMHVDGIVSEDATVSKLKTKMIKKGYNVNDYNFTIVDMALEKQAIKDAYNAKKDKKEQLKFDYINGNIDLSKEQDLARVVEFLLKQHGAF